MSSAPTPFSIRLDADQRDALADYAHAAGATVSATVRDAALVAIGRPDLVKDARILRALRGDS